jgi:hypothetical protein
VCEPEKLFVNLVREVVRSVPPTAEHQNSKLQWSHVSSSSLWIHFFNSDSDPPGRVNVSLCLVLIVWFHTKNVKIGRKPTLTVTSRILEEYRYGYGHGYGYGGGLFYIQGLRLPEVSEFLLNFCLLRYTVYWLFKHRGLIKKLGIIWVVD